MTTIVDPLRQAVLAMLASWMSVRYFRTFRAELDDAAPPSTSLWAGPSTSLRAGFDAILVQRDRRLGISIGMLWDETRPLEGAAELGELLSADMADPAGADPGYVVWVPPLVELPRDEPYLSGLRIALARGLAGLQPGDRREVRIPVTLKLAKIQDDGQYVSVTGVLSREWTKISEGVSGAFHLDARALHRLPDEPAELDIIISRIRDRAALLNPEELTDVEVHDYWRVSRLPAGSPTGVVVIAAPPDTDPLDGTAIRREFRRQVARAVEQRHAGSCDLSVLVVVSALGHIEDELATAALRGMNPALYGELDLIVLIADAQLRQVLQPRTLPWDGAAR